MTKIDGQEWTRYDILKLENQLLKDELFHVETQRNLYYEDYEKAIAERDEARRWARHFYRRMKLAQFWADYWNYIIRNQEG